MNRVAAAAVSLALMASGGASANDLDAPTIARVFAAACSISDASGDPGVTRQLHLRSGPPPGTMHGRTTLGSRSFELVSREGEFCAIRFDPLNPSTLRAELDQRFGAPEGSAAPWRVPVGDGEGLVAYWPYVPGRSGPAWITTHSGYLYGFNSAARLDTLIFWPPAED